MPDHARGNKEQDANSAASKSLLSSLVRWLQIKKYQYEVTFSLYMLTSTEKAVFNVIILVLFTLLVAAAVAYLPNHIAVISNRLWYYVHGEFLYATTGGAAIPTTSPLSAGVAKSILAAQQQQQQSQTIAAAVGEAARRAGEL